MADFLLVGAKKGTSVYKLCGSELQELTHLSDSPLYCTGLTVDDHIFVTYLSSDKRSIVQRTYSDYASMKEIGSVSLSLEYPASGFTVSPRGSYVQVSYDLCDIPSGVPNISLYHTSTATKVLEVLCASMAVDSERVIFPVSFSDDEAFAAVQRERLVELLVRAKDGQALKSNGFVSIIPANEPVRRAHLNFSATLPAAARDIERTSLIVCLPSAKGCGGRILVFRPRGAKNLEEGLKTVKPILSHVHAVVNRYGVYVGASGGWFLVRAQNDVDTSSRGNYYGTSTLMFFNLAELKTEKVMCGDGYVYACAVQPGFQASRVRQDATVEFFVTAAGSMPPKVTVYMVETQRQESGRAFVGCQTGCVMGNLNVNAVAWDACGNAFVMRGEGGMNGEAYLVRPHETKNAGVLATATYHSRTHALPTPCGHSVLFAVTKPRFMIDNELEVCDTGLKSLARYPFDELYSFQFLPLTAADRASLAMQRLPDGVPIGDVAREEVAVYVPPHLRKK